MMGARRHAALDAAVVVCLLLYGAAVVLYPGFLAPRVAVGFFAENAFLGIAAVGMTLVLISGGIDLSVGAVVGCSSILIATLVTVSGWHPLPAMALALGLGAGLGAAMGVLIHAFQLPPFIVTLAGMFLARGVGFVIHREALGVSHPFLGDAYDLHLHVVRALHVPEAAGVVLQRYAPTTAILLAGVALVWWLVMRLTRFGICVRAIGGAPESARLMGLPVGRTRVLVYAQSGLCASLAGAVYVLYTFSGNPNAGTMLELDAIAVAVIGGTSLFGGVGSVAGTVVGVVIFGIIQTAIIFDGRLNSWWTRIAIGALLLAFILFQRLIEHTLERRGR
jgi:simple sugar transport system permease protein